MDKLAMPGRCSSVDLGGLTAARNPISSTAAVSTGVSKALPFPFHFVDTPGSMLPDVVPSVGSVNRVV